MKRGNVIKSIVMMLIVALTMNVSAQVERDQNRKGGKRGDGAKDTEAALKRVKTMVEGMNKKMASFMISMNINQMINLYTTDAISLPNYGPMLSGKVAIKKDLESMKKNGIKFTHVEFNTKSIEKAGNYFYEIGEYKMKILPPGMTQEVEDIGKYLNIWEKKGKEFLLKVEMWNTDVNPMKMMGGGDGAPEKDPPQPDTEKK